METRHVIDICDLSKETWLQLVELAGKIAKDPAAYAKEAEGKVLATLFYEPSTRTQMSFQTAMLRLGGKVIGFSDPNSSSVSKGETIKDTVRVISGYADIIAMRHPMAGAAKAASMASRVPVINAGDGGHLHPTQTLTDLVTLSHEKGRLDHLCIGLCGDLENGRTVHTLIRAMTQFPGNSFVLISTPELALPKTEQELLEKSGCQWKVCNDLEQAIGELDVLYMTRIQRERFASLEEYKRQRGVYVLDAAKMSKAKKDMVVLHPLPRVDEITIEVDDDPRAKYFEQTEYGMYARMALMIHMLQNERRMPEAWPQSDGRECSNLRCITKKEKYLPAQFCKEGEADVCAYCGKPL